MKKTTLGLAVLLSIGVMLTGCGDEKKEAPKEDAKPAAQAVSVDLTGAKDENYGADKPEGVRKKAQNAYKAIGSYASQLESKKDLAKVDAIAGATVSYDQFNEAVAKAVEAAKK